ncbi:MAG: hypothetical protein AAB676_04685 [Verrucomicrobiota bacterium]
MNRLLNLGCGERFHPDSQNIDFVASHPLVRQYDLQQRIPIPSLELVKQRMGTEAERILEARTTHDTRRAAGSLTPKVSWMARRPNRLAGQRGFSDRLGGGARIDPGRAEEEGGPACCLPVPGRAGVRT